ncbi:hypothetical protein DAEQUDRAFT_250293 [Daedalea quercina L-15889]|uniref:Uncharacterized protein n=1 Tax=Daedalea quercina L-15889 TaxID=1314783 RepID=A0A165QNG3_9APHY|nr:hypothetical protein DAEQUDRAFT_250293 [Daedalea quercina L-15889]
MDSMTIEFDGAMICLAWLVFSVTFSTPAYNGFVITGLVEVVRYIVLVDLVGTARMGFLMIQITFTRWSLLISAAQSLRTPFPPLSSHLYGRADARG